MRLDGSRWKRLAAAPGWLRLAVLAGLVVVGWQVPGWVKPVPFGLAFGVFLWLLPALSHDLSSATGAVLKWLRRAGRWPVLVRYSTLCWSLSGLLALLVVGLGIVKAAPTWGFLATSSLREDETLNVEQYTSRNFARAVSSYDRARNHMLYNVINSVVPGGESTWPPRARALSFLSTAAGIALLAGYSALRGWWVPGAWMAAWLLMNQLLLRSLLEARGYGMLFCISVATCVAAAEWLRTGRRQWLWALAGLTVAGAYTLPYYLIFGGGILLALYVRAPSRETFHAGLMAAACLALLYLPLAADLMRVAVGYGRDYAESSTNNFASLDALSGLLQHLVPHGFARLSPAWVAAFSALVLMAVLSRAWQPRWLRESLALILLAITLMITFFFVVSSVPMRSASFPAGPMAFVVAGSLGGWMTSRPLGAWKGPLALLAAIGVLAVVASTRLTEPLIPRQDWRTIGLVIERILPTGTRVWADEDYAEVLQWNRAGRPETAGGKLKPGRFASDASKEEAFAAVDAQIHDWAAARRPAWSDLPADVRYVTFPLLRNFQRLFFMPPGERGIQSVTWNGAPLPVSSPGVQRPDLSVLARSDGDHTTDPLLAPNPQGAPIQPGTCEGAGELVVALDVRPFRRFCNLLFSPHLASDGLNIEWSDGRGIWHAPDSVLHAGELLSVEVPAGAVQVRIRVPDKRPAFGLIEAWMSGGEP